MEHVIKPVVPAKYLDDKTIFHLNPSGRFVIGGPHGDAGLTGRKIIIDTYGGWGAHGGGAFSGKDPTKVDRSGAYIARQAAKSIVAAGLARRALVQVSYAIGVAQPLSVHVDTYGTGTIPDKEILAKVLKNFDFRPGMIAAPSTCSSRATCKTAAYGHFGREPTRRLHVGGDQGPERRLERLLDFEMEKLRGPFCFDDREKWRGKKRATKKKSFR